MMRDQICLNQSNSSSDDACFQISWCQNAAQNNHTNPGNMTDQRCQNQTCLITHDAWFWIWKGQNGANRQFQRRYQKRSEKSRWHLRYPMMLHFGSKDAKICQKRPLDTKTSYICEGQERYKVKLLFTK